MDRTTALTAAGALTMTSVAAVGALFLAVDRSADAAPTADTSASVQYEVVTVPSNDLTEPGAVGDHIEYVTVSATPVDDHEYEEYGENHDDHEYEDDDDHEGEYDDD